MVPGKSTTVRYAFPLVFAFAALLAATALVSENASFVHLKSSVKSVNAGDQFAIEVYVTAHVPVNAVDLKLEFPLNQIRITGVDTGESVITLWTEEPTVKGNSVLMRGGTFRKGFLGDHLIATINAEAVETGVAEFSIGEVTLLAGDGSGSKVKVTRTGEEETKLFIVDEDGALTDSSTDEAIGVKGIVSVVIVTDIDGDGNVTLGDISRFMVAWQNKSTVYDFNGDGSMTFRDFGIILADSFLH
jgi:hypothetical protein